MNDFDYPDCFAEARSRYTGDGCGAGLLDLPPEMRPRERLLANGPAALSDMELLAVMLNTGTKGKDVSILAEEVLGLLDRNKDIPPAAALSRLAGMGKTKASSVAAMLEFGRRRWGSVGTCVKQPLDIFTLVRHNADRKQERFISISLNGAHEALAVRVVTIGLLNRTIVHPREVFADLIQDRAAAFAVAHNHPSGKIRPSPDDDEVTERLKAASDILGLHFLDHLIFSENDWWSYRQNGRIGEQSGEGGRSILTNDAISVSHDSLSQYAENT